MSLDPLKFQVAIQDDATKQLDEIEKKFQGLKDKTISVRVEGLQELQNLLSTLQHKQVETIGKDVASGIHDAAKGLQEEAQKAIRTSLGNLAKDLVLVKEAIQHDNFTAFSTRITKCAEAVNILDEAFKKFHITIGSDAGMKNFMTGLGEVIKNVRTTMGSMEVIKNGNFNISQLYKASSSDADTIAKHLDEQAKKQSIIETNQRRYNETLEKTVALLNRLDAAGQKSAMLGIDASKNSAALSKVQTFYEKLTKFDPKQLSDSHAVSELSATYNNLKTSINGIVREQEKLIAAKEKAIGMSATTAAQTGVNLFSSQNTEEIRKQIDAVGALYMRIKELSELTHSRSSFNKSLSFGWDTSKIPEKDLLEVYSQTFSKLRSELKQLKESGYDVKEFNEKINLLYITYEKFAALQPVDIGKKLGLEHLRGYTGPSSAATDVQWAAMKHQAEVQEVAGEAAKRHQRKLEELTNAFAQYDAQVAKSQRIQEGNNKARQEGAAALRKQAEELVKARMEMLKSQSVELSKLLSNGKGKLGAEQYDAVRNALRGVREEMRQIEGLMQRMGNYSTRNLFDIGRGGGMNYSPLIANTQKLITAKEQAAQASSRLTTEEQRLAQALNHTTESARGQSQVLSDLKSMATQYLGVWGGQQFLHNIIEIGGQLEMQRLSIGAILQNQGQANELFNQIKGLATQSPFGVVQLDQMTKQLTAYGFQYHELFDMTKRLADISAATGTDVSRLALALGHVRSEAALSGYTLRQFSMGNVPLLQKLAEKLGKTTKEIREMVKGKEISYEDVVGVLKDLTDDGGMFHNMQEVISESVKAKFKNVKDAMDIMYGEMAESGLIGGTLKEVASVLMTLTKNWRTVGAAIAGVVIPMTAYKLAMIAVNKGQITANIALGGFTAKQLEAQAVTGSLTRAQLLRAVASQKMAVADAEAAGAVLGLTRAQLMFVAKSGNISAAMNKASLAVSKYSVAQLRMLATAQQGGVFSTWVARTRIGLSSITAATKSVATAFLGLARSFLPLAAISAVFSLISRSVEASSKAVEMAKDIAEKAKDSHKTIVETFKEAEEDNLVKRTMTSNKVTNGQFVATYSLKFDEDALSKANLTDKIENLKEQLQNLSPMYEGDLLDINKAESQAEQYKIIMQKLESIRHMNDVKEATSDVLPNANKRVQGGNWLTRMFGDDFITDISDYDKRMKDSVEKINQINEVELDKIDKALNGKLTKIKNDLDLNSLNEALKHYFMRGSHLAGEEFSEFLRNLQSTQISNSKNLFVYYLDFMNPKTFGRSLDSQKKQLLGETEEMAKSIATAIKEYYKDDPEGARYALRDFFNQMFTEAGTTDDVVMQEAMNKILQDMTSYLPSDMQESIINGFQRQQVMMHFSDIIIPDEIAKAKTDKELDNLFNGYLEKIRAWAKYMNIDLKKLGLDIGGAFFGCFREAFDAKNAAEQLKADWQKRAGQVFSRNTTIKGKISVVTDMDVFAQAVQKDLKEKQEYLKRNAGHLRHTMHITSDVLVDAGKLKLLMDKLAMQAHKLEIQGKTDQAKALMSKIQDEISPYYDALISVNEDKSWLKKEGYPEEKQTSKKTGKTGKKGGTKTYKDEFAKRWDERIRIMKEAYDWYDKWEKKVGKEEAINKVVSEYGDIFKEWKTDKLLPMDFDVNNIEDFLKYVEKIRDDALARYRKQKNDKSKNNGEEALRVLRQAKALLKEFGWDTFGRAAEKFKSEMDLALSDLQRKWDMFNEVRNATGSREIAANILGMDDADRSMRNMADATRSMIENSIASMGDAVKVPITFDINMSDKQIEENVKNALGGTEYQEQIDSIVEALKKWRELQRNVLKDDISSYAKLIGSAVDYKSQLKKINDELEKTKTSNANLVKEGKISQEDADKANKIAEAQAEEKRWKMSIQYVTLMNSSLAMTREQVEAGVNVAMKHLQNLLDNNLITADNFSKEMRKLNDIKANWDKNALFGENTKLTAFMRGGLGGLEEYFKRKIDDANIVLASKDSTNIQKRQADAEKYMNEKQLKRLQKFQNKLSGVALVSDMVMGAFDGLQKAAQSLSEMFDALGNEGAANFWSDVSDTIGGISSIFAPAENFLQSVMSGNVSGMVSSAIAAPVQMIASPITAFSRLHDKKIERHIAKLRESVQRIENNTSLIVQARERTLGYDAGNLRRIYAQQYAPDLEMAKKISSSKSLLRLTIRATGFTSTAQKDMYEYYSRNSEGTGYQQEYQNLLQQREDYMNILNAQESKKKKSQSDIEETKKKISELDDQIRYFGEDLAKELWSIDIKGWADQFTDAMLSAFENGENLMKAFDDTAKSIMQSVVKEMLKIGIIEPMIDNLRKKLFGYTDAEGTVHKGAVTTDEIVSDPANAVKKILTTMGEYFKPGGEGSNMMTATKEYLTGIDRLMQDMGFVNGLGNNESSNTLTSSIQGTSEETSGLIAGYLNAARQDLAVNRILLTQFVSQLWPEYVEAFAGHIRTVANIDANVQLMMSMMRDGNGALYNEISSLRSRFDNVVDGIEQLAVR